MRRCLGLLILLLGGRISVGQTSAPPAQHPATTGAAAAVGIPAPGALLSPEAAYEQANLPLDITRRDTDNWSEIEKAALNVAVAQAKDACLARVLQTYAGSDLVAYARLCAMGKQWLISHSAADAYIASKDSDKPLLAEAYSFEIQADFRLGNEKPGLQDSIAMLNAVPYGPVTDDITTAAVRYLQFAYTGDAITLMVERQPYLLQMLRDWRKNLADANAGEAAPPIAPHTLFEHAIALCALEQYDNFAGVAEANLKDIDAAMPATLPSDEAIWVANDRRQYALLGTHFPELPGAVSLLPATETPKTQPKFGSVTFFLLFPGWCVQCARRAQDLVPTLVRNSMLGGPAANAHIYALLADAPPVAPPKPAVQTTAGASGSAKTKPKASVTTTMHMGPDLPNAEEALRRTPTLLVAPSTVADFNASDFPFLIVTDHDGMIRLMVQAAPDNLLEQNGPLDQIAVFVLQRWPAPVALK